MRLRPDEVPGVGVVGVAGLVWGLGLARLLAEAGLQSVLYTSGLAVALLALGCAVSVVALWRLSGPAVCASFAIPLALPALYTFGTAGSPLAGRVLLVGGAGLALLTAWQSRPDWLAPALLGLMTLVLDVHTLLPSVGEADTLEFQVVAARLGVAHPTGYPLYILLGKLFTWLPVKSVAWRVNLASAVFAAAAVVVLYGIVHRLTDRSLLSFLVGLAFAFSSTFWSQAVIAEVYTLHSLLVGMILLLLLRGPQTGDHCETTEPRHWRAVLFLLGLSLANHLTTALLVPAVGLALFWDRPQLRVRQWLAAGGLFLLGLSVYLFIPLRWPALNEGRSLPLREFLTYITGGQFHGALRLDGWRDPTRWRIVWRLLWEPFGWIGLALAALGVANLTTRGRRALALTGVTFIAFFAYGLDYFVADIAVFLIPAYAILAVWMGSGAAFLAGLPLSIRSLVPGQTASAAWRAGLATLFALVPLSRIWINLPAVDRSQDRGSYAWGQYVLSRPLAEDSAILADTKKFAPLYYLQQVEGLRPDLDIVLLGSEELYQADVRRRLAAGQTVYLARYLPHLGEFYLRSAGPLVEVRTGPSRVAQDAVPAGDAASGDVIAGFEGGIQLLDVAVDEDPLDRSVHHVTLWWQAQTGLTEDFLVRLRLVDRDGLVRWTSEGQRPVNGLYPTNAWRVGFPVSDYHEVTTPPWLPAGTYDLDVGLFAPFGGEGVAVNDGSSVWLTLERLDIQTASNPDPLPQARLYSFSDGTWLTGFDSAGKVTAGAPLVVDLAWRNVDEDESLQFWWAAPQKGRAPAGHRQGEVMRFALVAGVLRSRHTIAAPSEAGRFTLHVRLVDQVVRCGWLASPGNSCALDGVTVLAAQEGLANFEQRILLLEADVGRGEARPGDVIPVTLNWRGLRTMAEDYTVFVHLVGPDGRLHGQADSWPVQGSYPTSQWAGDREVEDPYAVSLEPNAPPGRYRVEVGWYDLETMQRLQIVNGEGEPVADSYAVGTFDVSQ